MANDRVYTTLETIYDQMDRSRYYFWNISEPDGTALYEYYGDADLKASYDDLCAKVNSLDGSYVIVSITGRKPVRVQDSEEKASKSSQADNAFKRFKYRVKLKGYEQSGGGMNGLSGGGMFDRLLDLYGENMKLQAQIQQKALEDRIKQLEASKPKTNTDMIIEQGLAKLLNGLEISKDGIKFVGPNSGGAPISNTPSSEADKNKTPEQLADERDKLVNQLLGDLGGEQVSFFRGIARLKQVNPEEYKRQLQEIVNTGK